MVNENMNQDIAISSEEINNCIDILERLISNSNQIFEIPEEQRIALIKASGKLSRPNKQEFIKWKKDAKKAEKRKLAAKDRTARKETGIRSARESVVFVAPKLLSPVDLMNKKELELQSPRNCYVCKTEFTTLHHFYDTMCTDCGDFNYAKRFQTSDLRGQVAVITGSRLKIGYHITLMCLRAGATVVATTRFPVDSALRFSKETDFTEWGHRLKIHGLDLRHIPSVEIFCNFIEQKYERLDILINNAAQTVRRPAGFYSHLMAKEQQPITTLPKAVQDLLFDHSACLNELKSLNISKDGKLGLVYAAGSTPETLEALGYYQFNTKDYGFFESFPVGLNKAYEKVDSYITQFKAIFTPSTGAYKGVGGFKAIYDIFPNFWNWQVFWSITAFLSIMLGVLNLLPIPALDGGRVMFLLFEMVSGRKPSDKFLEYAQTVGFFILITLVLFANGNDIFRLFK